METFKGSRRFFYNLSAAGFSLVESIVLTFYVDFFMPPKEKVAQGMTQFVTDEKFFGFLTILGIAMFFGRFIDAFVDPVVASMSDRSKSKLGRRKKFLMIGGLPLILSAVLIYFPPVNGVSIWNAVYLTVLCTLFFSFYTVFVAPYIALIPELGHTEKDRLNMTTMQGFLSILGGAVAMIGGPIIISVFSKSGNTVPGMQAMAVILGIICVPLLYSSVFAVDEKRFSNAQPSSVPFRESFKKTLNNRPFIIFLIANMCFWFIFTTVRVVLISFSERVLLMDTASAGLPFIVLFVSAIIFIVSGVLVHIIKKIGKRRIMSLGLACFFVFSILLSLAGLIPAIPMQVWAFIILGLMGFPVAIFIILPNVFISEACDYDRKLTGERREGIYFGVHGFFSKMVLGFVAISQGFFYQTFGKDMDNPAGIRLTIIFAGIIALIGMLVILRYPENEVEQTIQNQG